MFEKIDDTILVLGKILFLLSIVGGFIWIIISYSDGRSILIPIIVSISSCILSLLMYGFGEIIYHLKRMDYKLNGKPDEEEIEEKVSDEEIIKELEQDSEYKS